MNALFGDDVCLEQETAQGTRETRTREFNGVWRGPGGRPRNTRLSAVLLHVRKGLGATLREILGLPGDWPDGKDDFLGALERQG